MKDTSVTIGRRAETAAAAHLAECGYDVLELNYRRPHCEIDIVARRGDCIYLVEVKYRATDDWGSGLEYIGPAKLRHMERAARTWVREHGWSGDYCLAAAEVSGPDYEVTALIDSIIQ